MTAKPRQRGGLTQKVKGVPGETAFPFLEWRGVEGTAEEAVLARLSQAT